MLITLAILEAASGIWRPLSSVLGIQKKEGNVKCLNKIELNIYDAKSWKICGTWIHTLY